MAFVTYCWISWMATSTSNSILRLRFEIEKNDVALLAALEAKSTTAAMPTRAAGPLSQRQWLRLIDHAGILLIRPATLLGSRMIGAPSAAPGLKAAR